MKTKITPEIQKALEHVRQHFPKVCKVEYDEETRWKFTDGNGNAPNFNGKIDVGILEDAQNSINDFPSTFTLP